MSYFDNNEDYIIFGQGRGFAHKPRRRKETTYCKYCGEEDLKWRDTPDGWRLFCTITDKPHRCQKSNKDATDDFETLEPKKEKTMNTPTEELTYLIFDTETTGFPSDKLNPRDVNQGRACQVAFILCDHTGRNLAEFTTLIAPDDWAIQSGAQNIHGLSDALCAKYGVKSKMAFQVFQRLAAKADVLVAHNIDFDLKVMNMEARAHGLEMSTFKQEHCSMKPATDICKVPKAKGAGYKWPKLVEAMPILCGHELIGEAHDAMVDTRGCKEVYFELLKRGVYG